MFEYYNKLPDYLTADEVKKHLRNLLDAFRRQEVELHDFIKSLWALADRQWHTYSLLEPELRVRIDHVLSEIIKSEEWAQAEDMVCRYTMGIIGNIGLPESYTLLLTPESQHLGEGKKQEIKRLVDQINRFRGGRIEDPYAGGVD